MFKLKLHWQILIGLFLGVLYGMFFTDYVSYVAWSGDLFLRALKMLIVPLIFTSITSGIINIGDAQNLGRLGLKTFAYYITTSLFAIFTGLILVNLLQPGVGANLGFTQNVTKLTNVSDSLGNILLRLVPTNIISALSTGDMLAIIFFSILIGYFITKLKIIYRDPLANLFNGGFELMMNVTAFVIKFTPIGIFGIVAAVVADQAGDKQALWGIVQRLGIYMAAVSLGLGFHSLVTLPLLLKFVGKVDPWLHFKSMTTPLLTAFSTSSSSATLPLTMDAVENNAGVSNKITSFILPLGATINMDGTALYELVAAMFIAQAYGIDLSFVQQLVVVFTALLASIGAAGIPMAGLVMITVILSAVGLPLEGVGLILAVDRILDMGRTAVNVWSDSCGAVIIAKSEGETLKV
ncbi:MAG TPA: dicarboxylate/amino acid:cation symporter [Ignavibacteria bacterium]|nr:dicarboxylate/amino acid:cation symporter [Ignavibacteria bacterium]